MIRSNRLATLAATLLLSVGCTTDPTDVASGGLRFTGEIPATRTQYIIDEETKTAHVEWKANDEIFVFTADGTYGYYRATTAGATTDFVLWYGVPLPMQKDLTCYARYPSIGAISGSSTIGIPYLVPSTDPAAVDFMYASAKADAQGNVRFRFKHAYATLAISISNAICPDEENPKLENIIILNAPQSFQFNIEKQEFIDVKFGRSYHLVDYSLSESPITIYLPILPITTTDTENNLSFNLTINGKEYSTNPKPLPLGGLQAGAIYRINFDKENEQHIQGAVQDRAALIALYNAMGGANWTCKDNWGSDKPLSEWYGVTVDYHTGQIIGLVLQYNNLKGYIPKEIGQLTLLQYLNFSYNEISGTIPYELENLTNLTDLMLNVNQLTGSIPTTLGNLRNLVNLNLSSNKLVGSLPITLENLTKLESLNLNNNNLSGKTPASVTALEVWKKCGAAIVITNPKLNVESANAYYPEFTHQDIDGNTIHSTTKFKAKKYTALLFWSIWDNESIMSELVTIYNAYLNKGFNVIGFCGDGQYYPEDAKELIRQCQMNWCNIFEENDFYFDVTPPLRCYCR